MIKTIQIGLNTSDMPGTLRLYAEALGFRNAGGQAVWGRTIGVQGLGPDSRALMWWMVGAQDFFQLEIFQHTQPAQGPMPQDWRPSDHGWVRFGVLVREFDACVAALARHGVPLTGQDNSRRDGRRLAFRDPYIGAMVEVIEDLAPPSGEGPVVRYITSSVDDIASAREFYGKRLGFEILPLEHLHDPGDEELWGLPGAEREGFLVRAGDVLLEIVSYRQPLGRPRAADALISDQGIMNIAMGSRDKAETAAALELVRQAGYQPPFTYDEGNLICGYIVDAGREIEFTTVPREFDAVFGFVPAMDFLR